MASIDTDLLLLIAIAVIAVWVLVSMWRYVSIQSQKELIQQEQDIFGDALSPENREFMAVVVPRFGSLLGFLVAVAVIALLAIAKVAGYL
jgi:type IV secretory pathway TraG/TraD family ATPase VirD4